MYFSIDDSISRFWAKHFTSSSSLWVNTHFANPTGQLVKDLCERETRAFPQGNWKDQLRGGVGGQFENSSFQTQYLQEQCSWTLNIKLSSRSQNCNQWKRWWPRICEEAMVVSQSYTAHQSPLPRSLAHKEPCFFFSKSISIRFSLSTCILVQWVSVRVDLLPLPLILQMSFAEGSRLEFHF